MSPKKASQTTRDISRALIKAVKKEGILIEDILLVSRGDSTLRGHGVLEPNVIAEELGPFDATFHIPAFLEGGRTTVDGVHLLNGKPVHETTFARDKIFGYSTSNLANWLHEKSSGNISADSIKHLTIEMLETANINIDANKKFVNWLLDLSGNRSVVVDANSPIHLSTFVAAIKSLIGKKRFLFRSAASLISALANLPPNPFSIKDLVDLRVSNLAGQLKPGLVLVGSHVELADAQLKKLLQEDSCIGIELSVKRFASALEDSSCEELLADIEMQLVQRLENTFHSNKTPVLYTSRGEMDFETIPSRVRFGIQLAEYMARIVAKVSKELGYIISKGGVTTHVLLDKGFGLGSVLLIGQLLPGLSIVMAQKYNGIEDLPVITFPGNLGDENTLLKSWKIMENKI